MPCCEISDCAQMSKTIIAVSHFGLGGCESLETAVNYRLNSADSVRLTWQHLTSFWYPSIMLNPQMLKVCMKRNFLPQFFFIVVERSFKIII